MEWYLPLPIHLMDDKNGMGLVPIIDGNYQVITLFLMWQWYFTFSLGELGEFILPLIFVTLLYKYIFIKINILDNYQVKF